MRHTAAYRTARPDRDARDFADATPAATATLAAFRDYSPARHRHDDNMTEAQIDEIGRRQANLRYLLNEWDPIGVADLVPDEYECLLAPLWTLLSRGASRAEVSELLWYDLEDHFGLDPEAHDVDQFADRLVALSAYWSNSS